MTTLHLKAGQVAAVVGMPPTQLQNDVDAGYVRPAVVGQGRGSVHLFSVENVVQLTVLEILVHAYGLDLEATEQRISWVQRRTHARSLPDRSRVWRVLLASTRRARERTEDGSRQARPRPISPGQSCQQA